MKALAKLAENSRVNRHRTREGLVGALVSDISDVFLTIRFGIARVVSKVVAPHEVEDIVQETYVRLCQVGNPEQIYHPKAYLYRTALNLALDSQKRAENRMTEPWAEESDTSADLVGLAVDDTFEQVASSEEFGHFCEAVRQLPVQARRVFVLKKVYGYSQKEIASELRLAESTVEKHVALAVRRCTAFMQGRVGREPDQIKQSEACGE